MVTLEEMLAQLELEQQVNQEQLAQQIDASRADREGDTAGLLQALGANVGARNTAIEDLQGSGSIGLAATLDALNGTNFSRSAEALNNQRRQIISGTDPGNKTFNDDLATVDNLTGRDQLSFKEELQLELDAQKAGEKAKSDAIKIEIDAQKAAAKIEQDRLDREADAEKDRLDRAEKRRVNDSVIAKNRAQANKANRAPVTKGTGAAGGGGGDEDGLTRGRGFQSFISSAANRALSGKVSKGAIGNSFSKSLEGLSKQNEKIDDALTKANTALGIINGSDEAQRAGLGGLATNLAKAAGETGVLTDADIGRFQGSQDLRSVIKRFATKQLTGKLTPEDERDLAALANLFIEKAREKQGIRTRRILDKFSSDFGVTRKELLDQGFLASAQSPYTAEELGLSSDSTSGPINITDLANELPDAPPAATAPAAPTTIDVDALADEI